MSWILLASIGEFLLAGVAIMDKYIICGKHGIPRPFVYAFYSCLLTGFWVVVYFFGFIPGLASLGAPSFANVQTPTIQVVGMSFLSAYTFFMALVSLYEALKQADASDVLPVIGAVSAMGSVGMTYLFLNAELTTNFIWGIALLITGTLLVSQVRLTKRIALSTIHSGVFFALHFITMKGLFLETSFDDGFFWSRVSFVLFALSLLLVPTYWEKITEQTKKTSKKAGFLVFTSKIMAGIAAFLLLKATDLGNVAVVQALDGLKFVFIILLGISIGRFIPKAAGENDTDLSTIIRKTLYVVIITVGYVMLFV